MGNIHELNQFYSLCFVKLLYCFYKKLEYHSISRNIGGTTMEKVISLLFDIERKANTILERATLEKADLSKETEQAIREYETQVSKETSEKINLLHEQSVLKLDNEIKNMRSDYIQQLKVLESEFQTHHDEIINGLFQEVIQI